MPELNLEALRVAAEGATPGPWERICNYIRVAGNPMKESAAGLMVVTVSNNDSWDKEQENLDFIALANPSTILQLIARLEASERDGERYRELRAKLPFVTCDFDATFDDKTQLPAMSFRSIDCAIKHRQWDTQSDSESRLDAAIDAQIAARKE